MTNTKPIPESLHTVRVVEIMARYVLAHGPCAAFKTRAEAVEDALSLLGYAGTPDAHGIADAVVKALRK